MNGFANTLLSFILSWIRTLITNIWSVVTSEDGGALYRFLSQNWKTILLIMLIGGVVVDRLVYLFRWRPYYVWLSRWDRLRGKPKEPIQPVQEPVWQEPAAEARPTAVYQPASQPAPTMAYAPLRANGGAPAEVYTQVYAPVQEEPLFDEPVAEWEEPEDWQQETLVNFGQPRPEPVTYYHDVQAGFAPAIPPEQLYAPRVQAQDPFVSPVHPGLNEEAFRQSFGLEEPEPQPIPAMRAPAFRPFTAREEEVEPARPQSALTRLAKRARTLVSAEDEDRPLTFRDLKTTVDVSQSFHEPVYPQSMKNDER